VGDLLSLSLRPRSFAEMVGQDTNTDAIRHQFNAGRDPKAFLLSGDAGTGKTSLARLIALSYQVPKNFGSPLQADWDNYAVYAIREINASDVNGVDEIRAIADESRYVPPPGSRRRVYIIDECHRLTDASQNVLLKYVEDAPLSTLWIFATTNPSKMLKTLRDRCYALQMKVLDPDGIEKLIGRASEAIKFHGDLTSFFEAVVDYGVTSPRSLLNAFEKFAAGMPAKKSLTAGDNSVNSYSACQAVVRADWGAVKSFLRDSEAEALRGFRLALMGYLRGCVLKGSDISAPAAKLILALSGPPPYEDPAFSAWLVAIISQHIRSFRVGVV